MRAKSNQRTGKSFSRRDFVKVGLAGVAGAVIIERGYDYFSESKAKAKIVIVGGGAAGITMAAYLSDMLRYDDITIIEPNEIHDYQPGYTLIAADIFTPEEVRKPTAKLIPSNVKWVKANVTELHPDNNSVVTDKEGTLKYDFLVLVPGCQLNFNLIEGVSKETLGEGNAHCIYDLAAAQRCRDAIKKLPELKGGNLIFTDTYSKLKCGGVPKKVCLITEDFLRDNGVRNNFDFQYFCNEDELMKPRTYGDRLATIYAERGVATKYRHRLKSVDTAAKKAVFNILPEPTQHSIPVDANYEEITVDYDFLHFTPPMSVPDFVMNSEVTDSSKPGGWINVNRETLVHSKYKNIIALGDVAKLASKTGAAIRMQAPVAAKNLVALMEGKEPVEKYNGYSACPIVTEYGKVLMCEYGYDSKLLPTIPWLDPGMEYGIWWMLKVHGLKPMYFHGMLKGLM